MDESQRRQNHGREQECAEHAELSDEELEQTTGGGYTNRSLRTFVCRKCGKNHGFPWNNVPVEFTCECGAVIHR